MTDLFTEYYGINATTYVDLSSSTDPHDQLETKLKDIVQNTLLPSYNNKEHVLLVFYFTGHGYADEQKRSQILLNMPIQKHRKGRKFLNPYRIEEKLIDIWNAYYNVCIELIVDACREKNRFEEHFKKINLEIPLTDTMPLLYNTMGGKLEDGTSRETNKPWPSEADDKRVNNFFARNYACQYGELTDAIPTKGYA